VPVTGTSLGSPVNHALVRSVSYSVARQTIEAPLTAQQQHPNFAEATIMDITEIAIAARMPYSDAICHFQRSGLHPPNRLTAALSRFTKPTKPQLTAKSASPEIGQLVSSD
jgi:hypothetical protein